MTDAIFDQLAIENEKAEADPTILGLSLDALIAIAPHHLQKTIAYSPHQTPIALSPPNTRSPIPNIKQRFLVVKATGKNSDFIV